MTANPVARHLAIIDDMLESANRRSGIGLPHGIDLTLHRTPTARVGAARYQEFFDAHAADPSPWSIDDMLPAFVLADRAIPQFPAVWIKTIPNTRPIDNRIQEILAAITIPTMPHRWAAYTHGHVVDGPPPWMRAHREALGLPIIGHMPDCAHNGRSQAWVMAALSLLALGAIVAWIILGEIR